MNAPRTMTARQFLDELADMPVSDTRKVTLLQAVRVAEGRAGAEIDIDVMMGRLARSRDTVVQGLNRWVTDGWVSLEGQRLPSGHWANAYRLAVQIDG